MRFLLIIPILALFLSNIPLEMEMTMPAEDMKEECCMKEQKEQSHCSMKEKEEKIDMKGCCEKKETTCLCFCCFQIVAPGMNLVKMSFNPSESISLYNFYKQLNWSNPFISGPLRPPNTV
jgi:hypothetical protein